MLDVKQDFPFFQRQYLGKPMVYLDSAATTQKPQCVIDRVSQLYCDGVSNIHRALNVLANEVTEEFEYARETVARFIGASTNEIIFGPNATYGLNLVASWFKGKSSPKILTTTLEHHSNYIPWLENAEVEFVDWSADGLIDLADLERKLATKPDLFTIAWCSNLLGTVQPIEDIMALCRQAGVPTLLDVSQSIPHIPCDVKALGCDFLVFSSHKIYGPSGVGVLYANYDRLEQLSPMLLGGSMVKEVGIDDFILNDIPYRFEAGTPNIEGVIGLGEAINYVLDIGYDRIAEHENTLIRYTKEQLSKIPKVQLLGPAIGQPCSPLATFVVEGLEATGVAKILSNRANIIIRSGFHCAQPAHQQLQSQPTCRASLGIYSSQADVDLFIEVLANAVKQL